MNIFVRVIGAFLLSIGSCFFTVHFYEECNFQVMRDGSLYSVSYEMNADPDGGYTAQIPFDSGETATFILE